MKIKTQAPAVWNEYQKGRRYNEAIDLFENVRVNENFYIGKQWEGLNAPDLPKPVLNFLKRVVTFIVATVVSDDIAISFTPHENDEQQDMIAKAIGRQCDKVIENTKLKTELRRCVRNAAVDGDACIYWRFDPEIETGQDATGDLVAEIVDNINVIFGNPYDRNAQTQPYIILAQRKPVSELRDEAAAYGMGEAEAHAIQPDSDSYQDEKGDNDMLATKLIKLWRDPDTKTIQCLICTETVMLKEPYDTGLKLYPLAWMNWEEIRGSYHGQATITGLIANQIEVNRLFACYIRSVQMNAFPKIVFDGTKIENWNPSVGTVVKTRGGVQRIQDAVTAIRGGDTSYQVMDVIDKMITMTRDFMGASDAALGNVRPDNTSAIIAVQQATTMPMELQKMALYQFVEDNVRVIVDNMRQYYGVRNVSLDEEIIVSEPDPYTGEPIQTAINRVTVDFSAFNTVNYDFNIDVGASSYWSELMQTKTMDNLYSNGIMTDAVTYLESIPRKYIPNKDKIIQKVKEQQELMQLQMQQQAAMAAAPDMGMPISENTPPPTDQVLQQVIDARSMVQDMAKQQTKGA